MFRGRSTNTIFDHSIIDEESSSEMRLWLEPVDCDTAKIGMELGSDTGLSGKIIYGLVGQKGLVDLLQAIKQDPEVDAITVSIGVELFDMEEDQVETVEEQMLIPLKGRFSMREFLVQHIPIAVSAMKFLPRLSSSNEPAVTMTTPRGGPPS